MRGGLTAEYGRLGPARDLRPGRVPFLAQESKGAWT
jgi:hypothetical protein